MTRSRGNANLDTAAESTVLEVIVRDRVVGMILEERVYPSDSAIESGVNRRRWDLRTEEVKDQRSR